MLPSADREPAAGNRLEAACGHLSRASSARTSWCVCSAKALSFNTSTGTIGQQNLGTAPMRDVQLGDDSTQHGFTAYVDDLTVSVVQPAF